MTLAVIDIIDEYQCQRSPLHRSLSMCKYGVMAKPIDKLTEAKVIEDLCCPSLVDTPIDEDEAAELGRVLAALGDPVRLRLLSLVASQAEVCSCDLQGPLGKTQPTISHHTKVLVEAGLLIGERRGRWVWWRVDEARFAAIRKALGG
jgi:ArsR family transcriptional regulator, arsenate/arsenite/antimonite-responsive transcriptional repressor